MTALPQSAQIELVRVYFDQPHLHGWHAAVAVRLARARKVRLLHLASLHEYRRPPRELEHAQPLADAPAAIAKGIRKRLRRLADKRVASALAWAIVARIEEAAAKSAQPLPAPRRAWGAPRVWEEAVQLELLS